MGPIVDALDVEPNAMGIGYCIIHFKGCADFAGCAVVPPASVFVSHGFGIIRQGEVGRVIQVKRRYKSQSSDGSMIADASEHTAMIGGFGAQCEPLSRFRKNNLRTSRILWSESPG